MEQLAQALVQLGLDGEVLLSARWARIWTPYCAIYVAEAVSGTRYYTWCDHPKERAVEVYPDPVQAIQAGLRRAAAIGNSDLPKP